MAYEGEYFPSQLQKQLDLEQDPQPFVWWRVNGYFPRTTDITQFDDKPVFRYDVENKLLIPYRADYEPNPAGQPAIDRVVKQGVILRVHYRAFPNPLKAGTGAGPGAGADGVLIWTDPGFVGQSVRLGTGRNGPAQLSGLAGRIQSIQMPAGVIVTLYENSDFTGPSLVLDRSSPDLSGWRNLAQSIEVSGTGSGTGANSGGGTVPPPAPTYGGTGPQPAPPQGGTVPPPPAPAPPGPVPAPPGPVPAPPAPAPPWGTQAPPPQPARRDGWSRLDPSISYEVAAFKILSKGGVEVRVAVPFDVAVVGQALLSGFDFVLLGDEAEDAQRGFRLSGGAAVRLAARSFPGRRPGDLGLPAWVATMTLRGVRLLSAQTLASLFGPDWAW